jgi:hypothetical protein
MEELVYQENDAYLRPIPMVTIHALEHPIAEARYAMQLAERFALIAADDDGEDSAGRQKLRLSTPEEVVDRACKIAHLMYVEIRDRNWMLPVEDYATVQKMLEVKRAEKKKKGE